MGLTWPGLLSLHEQMEMNGTLDRTQDSRQGGLSAGSQLGRGQDGAANPVALASEHVALMRSEGRQSRDVHERGAGETRLQGWHGVGQWLCADAEGNGKPVKDFSKSTAWLNSQPEHRSGMTPQDRRSK